MPPKKHSALGASKAEIWMNCPGMPRLAQTVPKEESVYAAEGTAAHDLAEKCLHEQRQPHEFVGEIFNEFEVTDEMADAVKVYVEFVNSVYARLDHSELLIEEPFHLSKYHPDLYGTNDASVVQFFGEVHIFDYKHGAGMLVEADENKQLMYYALGAMERIGWWSENVYMHIVQPRCEQGSSVSSYKLKATELSDWLHDVLVPAAKATEEPDAPLNVGPWCKKFCPAAGVCPALAAHVEKSSGADVIKKEDGTKVVHLPEPQTLTMDQLGLALDSADLFNLWYRKLHVYANEMAKRGQVPDGYKTVQRKTHRRFKDEEQVADRLLPLLGEDELYKKSLLSPNQLEQKIKKRKLDIDISDLWEKPEGDITLAKTDDPRKAVAPKRMEHVFKSVIEGRKS